jgi:hypothetical protein
VEIEQKLSDSMRSISQNFSSERLIKSFIS